MALSAGQRMALQDAIAKHLDEIATLFRPGAKLTCVVRNPAVKGDAGVVVTNDDLDEVIAEIQRRKQS